MGRAPQFEKRCSTGFRSGEFAGQSTFCAFGSVGRCQILLENEISIFKKLVSRRKHEVLQNVLVNGCRDVGFHARYVYKCFKDCRCPGTGERVRVLKQCPGTGEGVCVLRQVRE